MEYTVENIETHVKEHEDLISRLLHVIRSITHDNVYAVTSFSIDSGSEDLTVWYEYTSHGYSDFDTIEVPIKLLTASDEELEEEFKKRKKINLEIQAEKEAEAKKALLKEKEDKGTFERFKKIIDKLDAKQVCEMLEEKIEESK